MNLDTFLLYLDTYMALKH